MNSLSLTRAVSNFAILFVMPGQFLTGQIHAAAEDTDPYDRLYDVIMTRHGTDGKIYAQDESSPVIFPNSEFPFGDKTYVKFSAALDAFESLPRKTIEAYSDIKRGLLQRHLWNVFDATYPYEWRSKHKNRRAAVRPKLASLIQKLALPRVEIMALPDTREATIRSGRFAQRHDPTDPSRPFLPADLYSDESSWVCLGEPKHPVPASRHTDKLKSRSVFLQFMTLPGGRGETLRYFEKLHRREVFPVGTQFALIEQAFLISDTGELVLSPLVVSIQLRAYLDVDRDARRRIDGRIEPTQCVAEFVLLPRQLMKGNAVMKAMTSKDFRFEAGQELCRDFTVNDPFEKQAMPMITRLNLCAACHGGAGVRSIATVGFYSPHRFFEEGSPKQIGMATSAQKRTDDTWKTLHEFFRADTTMADPYDLLYDVIRKDKHLDVTKSAY